MTHIMNTYARQPVGFVRGEGSWLFDESGKRYLDALCGIAVTSLGHAHPKVVAAICEQAKNVIHTSNLYRIPRQEELADLLASLSGLEEAFFCSSGAEANEAAIKLARLYGHKNGVENSAIIVMEKAWHGRTLATLSATGSRKAQAGFEPLMGGFVRVPYNDREAVKQVGDNNRNVVAVMVEMLQGEGGVNVADLDYIRGLRQICTARDWLLIVDEVQCGIGRTARWFGYQHAGILPDVITLAKGLGSGVPVGACLGAGRATGVFTPGTHGATFGGGPLASAAAIATLQAIKDENLLEAAERTGERIRSALEERLSASSGVVEIRGRGMMIGIELDRACGVLVDQCRERGALINVTADNVVRLLPPLNFKPDEVDLLVDIVSATIGAFLKS
jgi:acetylornithine/N-succinyldiaminopimelate aminotransferase